MTQGSIIPPSTSKVGIMGIAPGEYAMPTGNAFSNTITTAVGSNCYFIPFSLPPGFVCDQVKLFLTTAQPGAGCLVGFYDNDYVNGRPGNLIVSIGEIDLSAGSGAEKTLSVNNVPLPPNCWAAIWMKAVATQATFSGVSGPSPTGLFGSSSANIDAASQPRAKFAFAAYPSPAILPARAIDISGTIANTGSGSIPIFFPRRR
mgnify:CR=1 FL=1